MTGTRGQPGKKMIGDCSPILENVDQVFWRKWIKFFGECGMDQVYQGFLRADLGCVQNDEPKKSWEKVIVQSFWTLFSLSRSWAVGGAPALCRMLSSQR